MTRRLTHNITFDLGTIKVRMTGTTLVEDVEEAQKPKPRNRLPTSPEALFVASLFNRKPTTEWSDREIDAYSKVKQHLTAENMDLIGAYYKAQRSHGDGIHRRDLLTFLNNLPGEIDRAKAPASKINGHKPTTPDRNAGTLNEGRGSQYRDAGRIRPATES